MVVACVFFLSGVATAGKPLARPTNREAREHLDRGNRLYNTRSFDEAIVEFKAGALVEPASVFDYNLGQAYRQLGKYNEAIWHYERFLIYGKPDGKLLEGVNAFLKEMRAQLANRALTMPPTEPAPLSANDTTTTPAVRTSPASEPRQLEVSSESATVSPRGPDWFGWGMAATGVAAMGAAGALLLSSSHLSDQANTELDVRQRNQLHDQAGTRSTVGVVIGIGGIGLTTAGIIKLVLHGRDTARHTAALDIGITSNGAFVVGSF